MSATTSREVIVGVIKADFKEARVCLEGNHVVVDKIYYKDLKPKRRPQCDRRDRALRLR